jgi:hypothetical protein
MIDPSLAFSRQVGQAVDKSKTQQVNKHKNFFQRTDRIADNRRDPAAPAAIGDLPR